MALNEMRKLAQVALERFKVRDVRIIHRLGGWPLAKPAS